MRFAIGTCFCAAALFTLAGSVCAAPITVGVGASTYTYNAGTEVSDPNAIQSNTTFTHETDSNIANYYNTTAGGMGSVEYTFNAPAGYKFRGNASEIETTFIAVNPGGTITHEVSVDGGAFTTIATDNGADGGYDPTRNLNSFNVNGATTFTLEYVLNNPSGTAILTQLFRENNGDTSAPFEVFTTTAAPEPASLAALAGLGGMGLLGLALRRRHRNG